MRYYRIENVEVDTKYEQKIRQVMKNGKKNKPKPEQDNYCDFDSDSNDQFFYIAGYTSNGVPFGITWEEAGEEPPFNEDD